MLTKFSCNSSHN